MTTGDGDQVTCAMCGQQSAERLGWSSETVDGDATRWVCPGCTRRFVRSIEGKLDRAWW